MDRLRIRKLRDEGKADAKWSRRKHKELLWAATESKRSRGQTSNPTLTPVRATCSFKLRSAGYLGHIEPQTLSQAKSRRAAERQGAMQLSQAASPSAARRTVSGGFFKSEIPYRYLIWGSIRALYTTTSAPKIRQLRFCSVLAPGFGARCQNFSLGLALLWLGLRCSSLLCASPETHLISRTLDPGFTPLGSVVICAHL